MIIGTAGHIDHGKTTLVRALTGVDTDRLAEEKARGMTIELGYAYAPLAGGRVLGFVDVPGHERLVRTMVAGSTGIDFALLVVAADDGVMPQTLEHVAILELLGVSRGAIALSKIDLADAATLRRLELAIRERLTGTPLEAAPIFPVHAAAPDDPGTNALRRHLEQAAESLVPRRDDGLFRLAVDRVFTLAGHGTVVTGTVYSGTITSGDTAVLMPANIAARVRGIHAQNRAASHGRAGERCALNLAGVDKRAVSRGDWLADPRALVPTERLDVRLRILPGSRFRLVQGAPVHVHLGTAHAIAHVVPLEPCAPTGADAKAATTGEAGAPTASVAHGPRTSASRMLAGESARVQLAFASPVCALPGDRFIIRNARAAQTVGGGVVLDPTPPRRRRRSAARLLRLEALERMLADGNFAAVLHASSYGMTMTELERLTGLPAARIPLPSSTRTVAAGHECFVLAEEQWAALRDGALIALRDFHAAVPDEPGPDIGRLRRIAFPPLSPDLWRALIDALVRDGDIVRNGAWLHLPEHEPTLSDADRAIAERLEPLIESGGFNPPWVRDLAASIGEHEDRVREVLRKQVQRGSVAQVVRDLFYDSRRIGELAAIVAMLERTEGAATAARFRDATGLGRKRAIQILEFFDRTGYTRRVRDAHVLRS